MTRIILLTAALFALFTVNAFAVDPPTFDSVDVTVDATEMAFVDFTDNGGAAEMTLGFDDYTNGFKEVSGTEVTLDTIEAWANIQSTVTFTQSYVTNGGGLTLLAKVGGAYYGETGKTAGVPFNGTIAVNPGSYSYNPEAYRIDNITWGNTGAGEHVVKLTGTITIDP